MKINRLDCIANTCNLHTVRALASEYTGLNAQKAISGMGHVRLVGEEFYKLPIENNDLSYSIWRLALWAEYRINEDRG